HRHRRSSRRSLDVRGCAAAGGGVDAASVQKSCPKILAMLSTTDRNAADRILVRAAWRLIPFMAAMYVASFLDRVNISFAALQMNQYLGFSPEIFGFASGIFFWGYFFFEVPSNLMLQRFGARLWMCRICVTWGVLSMMTAFVTEPISFCVLRF